MSLFYFDASDPATADGEGLDMPDADAACREARVAVAEMLKDVASRGGEWAALEVWDDQGRRACTVTARITVNRP